MRLILSIFPGVGLLDRAFEECGFCVVRGPDLLWGGDVRTFEPPYNVFWGIIGGPPCQDFSAARRAEQTGYGRQMLREFCRVVQTARPQWWLMENVPRVPSVQLVGYRHQRFDIDQAWYEPISRLRHIQFGSLSGQLLNVPIGRKLPDAVPAALACDDRPWPIVRALQGLPETYELPPFTTAGKVAAVGNGVPLCIGRVLAAAVCEAFGVGRVTPADAGVTVGSVQTRCRCGCGRVLRGRQLYAGVACRKRAERRRRACRIDDNC